MHRAVSSLFVVLLLACASGPARPSTIPAPDIATRLVHPIFFGSGSSAPAAIDVSIRNSGSVPITIRRVEVDSPGMTQYRLVRSVRSLNETLDPGATTTVQVFGTAVTQTSSPSEPLAFRTIVEFQSGKSRWREIRFGGE